MFVRLIAAKLGIKENKYLFALLYGFFYALLFFAIFILISSFSNRYAGFTTEKIALTSLGVGILMSAIFLVRWEMFSLILRRKS